MKPNAQQKGLLKEAQALQKTLEKGQPLIEEVMFLVSKAGTFNDTIEAANTLEDISKVHKEAKKNYKAFNTQLTKLLKASHKIALRVAARFRTANDEVIPPAYAKRLLSECKRLETLHNDLQSLADKVLDTVKDSSNDVADLVSLHPEEIGEYLEQAEAALKGLKHLLMNSACAVCCEDE